MNIQPKCFSYSPSVSILFFLSPHQGLELLLRFPPPKMLPQGFGSPQKRGYTTKHTMIMKEAKKENNKRLTMKQS